MAGASDLRLRGYCWSVFAVAVAAVLLIATTASTGTVTAPILLFWIAVVALVELLPMSLGFSAVLTMGFPVHLTIAILFNDQPWIPMVIVALGTVDLREFRREIPMYRAAFNRGQTMLSVGAAALIFHWFDPYDPAILLLAAIAYILINFGSVAEVLHLAFGTPFLSALDGLLTRPLSGFLLSYILLIALGAVTARAEEQFGLWAVGAILIPLFFARLGLMGARAQQELSERLRQQQEALLTVSEQVFVQREEERKRIAAEMHDTSLQLMTAASYLTKNGLEYLGRERPEQAEDAIKRATTAIDDALVELRASLSDLRRSSVEGAGLTESLARLVQQASTLWGVKVDIEGSIVQEPPASVALTAFQIVQEALINALKHAQSDVVVRLRDMNGNIVVDVEDFGRGFEPEMAVGDDHVGLRLMRERAERLGGSVKLVTRPRHGTKVEVTLPGGLPS